MSLFDLQPLTTEEVRLRMALGQDGATVRKMSATGKVYTVRHKPWWMLLGKHPDEKTCAECRHLRRKGKYMKCGRQVATAGPGTDIRAKDQACRLFDALP